MDKIEKVLANAGFKKVEIKNKGLNFESGTQFLVIFPEKKKAYLTSKKAEQMVSLTLQEAKAIYMALEILE